MKRPRGYSLVEMIVASAVFFAVVAVGSDLMVRALRSTADGELRQTALDEGRNVSYRISSELRQAVEILDPDQRTLMVPGSPYLVFRTSTQTIGYHVGPDNRVRRTEYANGYIRGLFTAQAGSRRVTSAPTRLWFSMNEGELPPGQGGVAPGQDGDPGDGVGLALGHHKRTVQVELVLTPDGAAPVAMRTKKALWAGLFPVKDDKTVAGQ